MEHFEEKYVYDDKGGDYMKRFAALVLVLACVFGIVGCDRDNYSCRVVNSSDSLVMAASELTEPFIGTDERNKLIEQTVSKHLKCMSDEFTYEITSEHLGLYENKNTMLYWLHVVDAEGFAHVIGILIQD